MEETAITVVATAPTNQDELDARLRQLREWKRERIAEVEAATDAMNDANYRKEKLNAFDWVDKRLKDFGKAVATAATPDWAKALTIEVAASCNEIKAVVDTRKDKLRELKAANDPKPEQFEYILEVCADQKAFEAILKKLDKDGVEYRARRVKDGESAKIAKLFEVK